MPISNNPPSPVAYNIKDFCQAMGIGRSSTYILISQRKLKTIKIAGRTLIPASEAARLLAEAMS